ncbi:hypothetical protein [Nocardia sp. AB354]
MLACELALGGVTATVLEELPHPAPNPRPMASSGRWCG